MKRVIPNISVNYKRYFLAFVAILSVLLTSCAVKNSIKTLAGIPTKAEQGLPKATHNLSGNTAERCADFEITDTQIIQKFSFTADDFLPLFIYTATFLFLFGFRPVNKEHKHPLYSSSGKIRGAIPIFLEYRKLLLHYSG